MTDDLVKRLRAVDHMSLEDCFCQSSLYDQAADRIEALTAEYEEAMECNEQFFADNEFLKKRVTALIAERDEMAMSCLSADGEAQRAWDAQKAAEAERDRQYDENAHRIAMQAKAEAERDRLREALTELLEVSRRAVRLSVEHDNFKLYAMEPMERAILLSRAALKGETP